MGANIQTTSSIPQTQAEIEAHYKQQQDEFNAQKSAAAAAAANSANRLTTIESIEGHKDPHDVELMSVEEIAALAKAKDKVLEIKEEWTQADVDAKNKLLRAPLNWTDPIVWHDPTFFKGLIVKTVDTDAGNKSQNHIVSAKEESQSAHRVDAIFYPLVRINQVILDMRQIISFKLESRSFFPELYMCICDKNNVIKETNSSGMNNEIILVITASIDGIYHKIKLPFYADRVTPDGDYYHIHAKFKLLALEETHAIEMNYNECYEWPGCMPPCNQPPAIKPNTWETLHYIAEKCELGFASTHQCKEVPDRRYRFFKGTWAEYLENIKSESGLNEDTLFDWWVDVYGYLVMVNVPYVMGEDINPDHLAIYAVHGKENTNENAVLKDPYAILVHRTLTNSHRAADDSHNLRFIHYEIVTNNDIYNEGTLGTFNFFQPKGHTGDNGIEEFQIKTTENSVTGKVTHEYETTSWSFKGVEMLDLPLLAQKTKYDRYFTEKRAKMLKLTMYTANLGLQRGTLVNVIITTHNIKTKDKAMHDPGNIWGQNSDPRQQHVVTDAELPNQSPRQSDFEGNDSVDVPNEGISGIYYIDGITYEYHYDQDERIVQTLYLIKKGQWGNFISKYNGTRFDIDGIKQKPTASAGLSK